MRKNRMLTALCLAAALSVTTAGCSTAGAEEPAAAGGPPAAADRPTIRLGWLLPGGEIFYSMLENPEIAENLGVWYDVEWFQFASSSEIVQGIAAGTLDGGAGGSLTVLNGIEQGADFVLAGEFISEGKAGARTTWLTPKDSDIRTAADVAGHTVGSNSIGSPVDRVARAYLEEEAGLKADVDYDVVAVPFSVATDTLLAGTVDIAPVPEPFLGAALATGEFREVFDTSAVQDPFIQNMLTFSRSFADKNVEATQKFVEDFTTVAGYVVDPENREAVVAASSAVTKIPIEALDSFLFTKRDYLRPEDGALDEDALQANWDFFISQGTEFTRDYKVTDYVDERFSAGRR
ncbi:MAG: transporter substrate-binding protein [Homoserinimonas sp.]|jgi:NitT/TauT family transport system substrate-binding protein|nr:transporter substrate-binding protein [Homoserinimonas sp.]